MEERREGKRRPYVESAFGLSPCLPLLRYGIIRPCLLPFLPLLPGSQDALGIFHPLLYASIEQTDQLGCLFIFSLLFYTETQSKYAVRMKDFLVLFASLWILWIEDAVSILCLPFPFFLSF